MTGFLWTQGRMRCHGCCNVDWHAQSGNETDLDVDLDDFVDVCSCQLSFWPPGPVIRLIGDRPCCPWRSTLKHLVGLVGAVDLTGGRVEVGESQLALPIKQGGLHRRRQRCPQSEGSREE